MSDEKGSLLFRRLVDVLIFKNPSDETPFIDCMLKSKSLNKDIAALFNLAKETRDESLAEKHMLLACKLISKHPSGTEIAPEDKVLFYTHLANYKFHFTSVKNIDVFADAVYFLYNLVDESKRVELPQSILTKAISSKGDSKAADKVFVDAFPAIAEKTELFTPLVNLTLSYAISSLNLSKASEGAQKNLDTLKNPEFLKKMLTKPIASHRIDRDIGLLLLRSIVYKVDSESATNLIFAFGLCYSEWLASQAADTQEIIMSMLYKLPTKDGEDTETAVAKQLAMVCPGLSKSIANYDDAPSKALGAFCKPRCADESFGDLLDKMAPKGVVVLTWECGILEHFAKKVESILRPLPQLSAEALKEMWTRGVITAELALFASRVFFDILSTKASFDLTEQLCLILSLFAEHKPVVLKLFIERIRDIVSKEMIVKICEFVSDVDLPEEEIDGLPILASLGRFLVLPNAFEKDEMIAEFLVKVNKADPVALPTTAPALIKHFTGESADSLENLKAIVLNMCERERGTGFEVVASGLPNLTPEEIQKLEVSIYNEKREANEDEFFNFYMNRFRIDQAAALNELEKCVSVAMPSNAFTNIFVKHPSTIFVRSVFRLLKAVDSQFEFEVKDRARIAVIAHKSLPFEDKIRAETLDVIIDTITSLSGKADTEFTPKFVAQIVSTPMYCELFPIILPRAQNLKALVEKAVESLAAHSMTTSSEHSYIAPICALFTYGKECAIMRLIAKAVIAACKSNDAPVRCLEFAAEAAAYNRENVCEKYEQGDDADFILSVLPFALDTNQTTRQVAHKLLGDFFFVASTCTIPAASCDARKQFVDLAHSVFQAAGNETTSSVVQITSKKVQLWCVLATTASIDALQADFCKTGILLNLFKNTTTTIEYAFDTVLSAAKSYPDGFAAALMLSKSLPMSVRLIETLLIEMPSFPITLAKQALLVEKTPETLAKHLDIACAAHGAEEHPELITAELMLLGQDVINRLSGDDCLHALNSLTQARVRGKVDTATGAIAVFRAIADVLSRLEFSTVLKVLKDLLECIREKRSAQLAIACGLLAAPLLCIYQQYAATEQVDEVVKDCTALIVEATTEQPPRVVRLTAAMLNEVISTDTLEIFDAEVDLHLLNTLATAILDEKAAEFDSSSTSVLCALFNVNHAKNTLENADLVARAVRETINAVGPRKDNVDAFATIAEWQPAAVTGDDALQMLQFAVHTAGSVCDRALDCLRAAAGLEKAEGAEREADLDKIVDYVTDKTKEVSLYASSLIDGCTASNVGARWLSVLALVGLKVKDGVAADKFLIALYGLTFDIIKAKAHPLEAQAVSMITQFD